MIQQRSLATCIILTIVTCGIYGLYWMAKLNDEINYVTGDQNGQSGVLVVVLNYVTCNLYGIYWAYKSGEKLDAFFASRGMATGNRATMYLILEFIFPIAAWAMMQDTLNKLQ